MALKYKIPPGNPTAVWDDDANGITRDPYVSWQMHVNRTGRGGVDMSASNGTPIYAPMDCTVTHYPDGAGIAVRMFAADGSGWSDVFDHLSAHATPDNTSVPFGGLVGYSGDTGSPGAYHLHWHRLDPSGVRRIPWDYFTDGTTTPPIGEEELTTYELIRAKGTAPVYYSVNRIHRYHVSSESILNDYKFFIAGKGQDSAVKEVVTIASFGAVVA